MSILPAMNIFGDVFQRKRSCGDPAVGASRVLFLPY